MKKRFLILLLWLSVVLITAIATTAPSAAQTESTPESTAEPQSTGRVTGRIINGTPAGNLPVAPTVYLVIEDEAGEKSIQETIASNEGAFAFEDVPFIGGDIYYTALEYEGVPYFSEVASAAPGMSAIDLPIVLYEATTDDSAIVITSLISQMRSTGSFLEYADTYSIVNTGTDAFLTEERVGDNQDRVSLTFELPPGAVVVGGDSALAYTVDEATNTVKIISALHPNQAYSIGLRYIVPYSGNAVIEFAFQHAFQGAIGILVSTEELTLSGEWITVDEPHEIGDETVQLYGGTLARSAGETLRYEVTGGATPPTPIETSDSSNNLLPIALIVFALGVGLFGSVLILRDRPTSTADKDRLINGMLRQLDELDAEHHAGRLNHDLYQRRKADLQARLDVLRDQPEDIPANE